MTNLYLLYGTDRKIIEKRRNEIINSLGVDDFNISIFDMDEEPYLKAINDAKSIPFLSDYRVVVFRNASIFTASKKKSTSKDDQDSKQEGVEELKEYLSNPQESSICIFEVPEEKLDSKKIIYKEIKDHGEIIECPLLSKEEIVRYIDQRLRDSNHKIRSDARNELIDRIGENALTFSNEMDKLLTYLKEEEVVTLDIIEKLITKDTEDKIYELTGAIISRNRKQAIETYYNLLSNGYVEVQILRSISNKFIDILYAKELLKSRATQDDFMEFFRISKGAAYHYMLDAREMTFEKLQRYLNDLKDLDLKIKKGQVDPSLGIELFLLKI